MDGYFDVAPDGSSACWMGNADMPIHISEEFLFDAMSEWPAEAFIYDEDYDDPYRYDNYWN